MKHAAVSLCSEHVPQECAVRKSTLDIILLIVCLQNKIEKCLITYMIASYVSVRRSSLILYSSSIGANASRIFHAHNFDKEGNRAFCNLQNKNNFSQCYLQSKFKLFTKCNIEVMRLSPMSTCLCFRPALSINIMPWLHLFLHHLLRDVL